MAGVKLANVWKIYTGDVTAVRDFSLTIADREFLVLVGPSGCGKSTTLRMIAGLEEISRGTVAIGERVVNEVPPKHRDIAMVFQNYALYPHMTVFDNMAFGLKLRRVPRREIEQRVMPVAADLGLTELLRRRPSALSGGQRQRVALGRAIVRQPSVFLFDEPLSNLDAKMRVEMRSLLMHLHQRLQTTMIYVTHDQVEAMTLGDRIVVMKDGVALQAADPLTVYHYPANMFVARFIGTPPMNLFEGTLVQEGAALVFDGGTTRIRLPERMRGGIAGRVGRKVYFGIRPEALDLRSEAAADTPTITGVMDVMEKLGNEIIAHFTCGAHRFQLRLKSELLPQLKPSTEICPRLEQAHVFDGETGINLTLPETAGATRHTAEIKAQDVMKEVDGAKEGS